MSVCVGGGGRECQSCSPRCTGRMGDVWGRGEEEGQSCNQHPHCTKTVTPYTMRLSVSVSLSLSVKSGSCSYQSCKQKDLGSIPLQLSFPALQSKRLRFVETVL